MNSSLIFLRLEYDYFKSPKEYQFTGYEYFLEGPSYNTRMKTLLMQTIYSLDISEHLLILDFFHYEF